MTDSFACLLKQKETLISLSECQFDIVEMSKNERDLTSNCQSIKRRLSLKKAFFQIEVKLNFLALWLPRNGKFSLRNFR